MTALRWLGRLVRAFVNPRWPVGPTYTDPAGRPWEPER